MDQLIDGTILASTVFTPGVAPAACVSAYLRNCGGSANVLPDVPDTVVAGHYRVFTKGEFDDKKVSIIARAYNAAGANRRVTVVPSIVIGQNQMQLDIYVRDDAAALSEDFVNCEVTVLRLPL